MGVECKFDKNYVTSDWSLENITERDLQTKSFLTPTVTPDPRSPCGPLLSPLLESSCSLPHPTLTLLSPLCETYITIDRIYGSEHLRKLEWGEQKVYSLRQKRLISQKD